MNNFSNFTVEETNLLSIYMTGSKAGLVVAMKAALPFIDVYKRQMLPHYAAQKPTGSSVSTRPGFSPACMERP